MFALAREEESADFKYLRSLASELQEFARHDSIKTNNGCRAHGRVFRQMTGREDGWGLIIITLFKV